MSDNINAEESILLGGQISEKHPIFKDLAQIASSGFIWWFLGKATDPEWKKKPPIEKVQDIIYTTGQIEFIKVIYHLRSL